MKYKVQILFVVIIFALIFAILNNRFADVEVYQAQDLASGKLSAVTTDDQIFKDVPSQIRSAELSDDGHRILFLTDSGIKLWETGVGAKTVAKDTNISEAVISGDGLSFAYLTKSANAKKVVLAEEGFQNEEIIFNDLRGAWKLKFNRSGSLLLLYPAIDRNSEQSKLLKNPKLIKLKGRSDARLNDRPNSAKREIEIVNLNVESNFAQFALDNGSVQRFDLTKNEKKSFTVSNKVNISDFDNDGASDFIAFVAGVDLPLWRIFTTRDYQGFDQKITGTRSVYFSYRVGDSAGVPILGDFDGDGTADLATFTPGLYADKTSTNSNWQIYFSNSKARFANRLSKEKNEYLGITWCLLDTVAVPADYDGDGKTDLGCYEPKNKKWLILFSTKGFNQGQAALRRKGASIEIIWGEVGAVPFAMDVNGDGRSEIGYWVERDKKLFWKLHQVVNQNSKNEFQFGNRGDFPLIADANGDGLDDALVYNKKNGHWKIRYSGTAGKKIRKIRWKVPSAEPIVADYDGDGADDIGFFVTIEGNSYPRWNFLSSRVVGTDKDIVDTPPWMMMGRFFAGSAKELPQQVILRRHQRSVQY